MFNRNVLGTCFCVLYFASFFLPIQGRSFLLLIPFFPYLGALITFELFFYNLCHGFFLYVNSLPTSRPCDKHDHFWLRAPLLLVGGLFGRVTFCLLGHLFGLLALPILDAVIGQETFLIRPFYWVTGLGEASPLNPLTCLFWIYLFQLSVFQLIPAFVVVPFISF